MTRALLAILLVLSALSGIAMLWHPRAGDPGRVPLVWVSDNNPARAEQIATFNRLYERTRLILDYGNKDAQKIVLQCSAGVGPDLFDMNGDQMQAYAEAGVLRDVTEAAHAGGLAPPEGMWPTAAGEVTYQGKQYAYPCNVGADVLIYDKNVFDRLGLSYPGAALTWDEFFQLGQRIVQASASADGRPLYAVAGVSWKTFFYGQRGEFFDERGRPAIAGSSALRTALAMHRDLVFAYRLTPPASEARAMAGQGGWGSGSLNQFAAGRFAMVSAGEWALIAFRQAHRQQEEARLRGAAEPPLRLGCALLPRFAGRPPSYRIVSRSVGINAGSPRNAEAMQFLSYLAGPDYSQLLNQDADWLPGNPAYADLGVAEGEPDLARPDLHAVTKEAVRCGYSPRRSPLLLTSDVFRVLEGEVDRMESAPSLDIDSLLADAQRQLDVLVNRNLDRNPALAEPRRP